MWSNRIKTALLLAILSSMLLFLGNIMGGAKGLTIALIFAVMSNLIAYFFADKLILRMYNAQPLSQENYPQVYEIVAELSAKMNIPQPKLWFLPTDMANAFATGRNPQNASVAVTRGILEILDYHELRGVLAHELAHVKNRDILISTIAATFAAAIGYLANMLRYFAWWGGSSEQRKESSGVSIVFALLIAIIMPIAALLVQLAISRSREYMADEYGATQCQDPLALASALEKLHSSIPHAHLKKDNAAHANTAHLFIVHPFSGNGFMSWFSTHPPVKKRIERLKNLYLGERR